ncbi:MAG: hypothetical protein EZS28_006455, partial [Streblomastix strix]
PAWIDFIDVEGKMKNIIKKKDRNNIISLSQVLEKGIYSIEVQFKNTVNYWMGIGIIKNSFNIPNQKDAYPFISPYKENVAFYGQQYQQLNNVFCKGSQSSGNAPIEENKPVRAEFDSSKGTLIFFLDNIQQPVYITGIKEKVRFMV